MHDLGVVTGIGGHRDARQQGVQVWRTTDAQQLAALTQLVRDRDGVSRLSTTVQVENGVVDLFMRRPVEVSPAQHFDDVGDGVLAYQHGSEHALLSLHVLWRRTVGQRAGGLARRLAIRRHHLGNTHPCSLHNRLDAAPEPAGHSP
jgi:hypothetical protein